MAYNKCKDANPKDTVNKIKSIYEKMGIELKYETEERVKGIYSSTVTDYKNGWNTCGKGTTNEFCMASAFAESIEHLCSYFAYNVDAVSKEANNYLNFTRYPDEVIKHVSSIKDIAPHVYQDMVLAYTSYSNDLKEIPKAEEVEKLWSEFLDSNDTIFVPYYSVKKKCTVLLPEIILEKLCGSNGGGAGNTPEEAIGHALDEIAERYVKYQIYHNRLTPPTVSREYIQKVSTELYELILKIEELGNYKIVVKDASMGLGFPVIAVLLVDRDSQRYLVNFGAHPKFELALERCLTEMFQLYTPSVRKVKRKNMAKWKEIEDKDIDSIKNWVSLLRDDTGFIPDTFFAGEPSWKFVEWENYENYNNKYGMKKQLDNFTNLAEDIYIRSVSYLDFPVYRIYIPKISTTHLILDNYQFESFNYGRKMLSDIDKVRTWNKEILMELRKRVFNNNSFVNSLFFRSMSEAMTNSIEAAILYDLGDEKTAKNILKQQYDRYCDCALKELELASKKVSVKQRDELLELFYGKKELEFAICWREKNVFANIIEKYVINKNININGNTSNNLVETDKLHMRLKDMMYNNNIEQISLKEIIA